MINIIPGTTASVWLSLKEMLPAGLTAPSYKLELVREINGSITTLYPTDVAVGNKWSNFNLNLNLDAGNYSYKVTETTSNTLLEIGRAVVEDGPKVWPIRANIPQKANNVRVYKKN
jgi:hypothetical protein